MVNERDKVRTLSLCFDTILNNYLFQKFKLIETNEFNHLIYLIKKSNSTASVFTSREGKYSSIH